MLWNAYLLELIAAWITCYYCYGQYYFTSLTLTTPIENGWQDTTNRRQIPLNHFNAFCFGFCDGFSFCSDLLFFPILVCMCLCIFLSGNLFYSFFSRERQKKVNVRPCGHLLLHVREIYEMILINMIMSEYENDDRTEKQTSKSSLELRRWHRMMR